MNEVGYLVTKTKWISYSEIINFNLKLVIGKTSCSDGICTGGTNVPSMWYDFKKVLASRSFLSMGSSPFSKTSHFGPTSSGYAWIGGTTALNDLVQRPALSYVRKNNKCYFSVQD